MVDYILHRHMPREIKATDNLTLEVLAIPYGGPHGGRDAHGEYFSPATLLGNPDEEISVPVVHYHGLADDYDTPVEVLGVAKFHRRDERGVWMRVMLNKGSALARKMYNAAKEGYLRASSGALGHLHNVDEVTGEIKQWFIGELSVMDSRTHEPANDYAVAIAKAKARRHIAKQYDEQDGPPISSPDNKQLLQPSEEDDMPTIDEIREALMPEVEALIAAMMSSKMDDMDTEDEDEAAKMDDYEDEMKSAIIDEAVKRLQKDSGVQSADDVNKAIKAAFENHTDELLEVGFDAYFTRKAQKAEAIKSAAAKARSRHETTAPPVEDTMAPVKQNKPTISVGENLKYAHLSPEEMMIGIALKAAPLRANGLSLPLSNVMSEEYLRTAHGKTREWVEGKPTHSIKANSTLKATFPVKADEFNASDISGQGADWVDSVIGTTLWEKARNNRIYQDLVNKGMMEVELPRGAESVKIPTEGADPIAYSSPQANDLDATNRPEVTANVGFFGTGSKTLTPGEVKIATAYTVVLDEDSIIALAPQVNRQLSEKAEETIEQLMLNGDTATGASTNINLIDGTPGTGLSRPYYLASDGILKYPLVDATAYSRDASAGLLLDDYLETYKLLPREVRSRRDRLAFVVDADVFMETLSLPQLSTTDVAANRSTILTGEIDQLYGIPVFQSGFIELANSAGKVPNAGGTLGRLAIIYAPYWAFSFRRGVTIETDRDILSGTNIYVASFRMGLTERGAGAAAVTYNVGV